jgi:hypothetical protein
MIYPFPLLGRFPGLLSCRDGWAIDITVKLTLDPNQDVDEIHFADRVGLPDAFRIR